MVFKHFGIKNLLNGFKNRNYLYGIAPKTLAGTHLKAGDIVGKKGFENINGYLLF